MCFVWLSEQTEPFSLYIINRSVFITVVESVYSAVRTESLYNTDTSRPLTLYLLVWRIWWATNNASKGQMGFNLAFKGLRVM